MSLWCNAHWDTIDHHDNRREYFEWIILIDVSILFWRMFPNGTHDICTWLPLSVGACPGQISLIGCLSICDGYIKHSFCKHFYSQAIPNLHYLWDVLQEMMEKCITPKDRAATKYNEFHYTEKWTNYDVERYKNNIFNNFTSVCLQICLQTLTYLWYYSHSTSSVHIFTENRNTVWQPAWGILSFVGYYHGRLNFKGNKL